MLKHIGHPYSRGKPVYDVTFENVQAGERTSHLFRLANHHGGLVLGTGDLSELALGFTTYGVGDHMSHYNVNASVPKTLIQHLIRWLVNTGQFDAPTLKVLARIVDTRISPELVPGSGEEPEHSSEAVVGPYELQDFNLYLPEPLRIPAEQGRVSRARGVGRPRCRRMAGHCAEARAPRVRPRDDSPLARGVPDSASSRPASSSARRCRTGRRWDPAARSRHAATGARRAIRRRPSGWTSCARTFQGNRGHSPRGHSSRRVSLQENVPYSRCSSPVRSSSFSVLEFFSSLSSPEFGIFSAVC